MDLGGLDRWQLWPFLGLIEEALATSPVRKLILRFKLPLYIVFFFFIIFVFFFFCGFWHRLFFSSKKPNILGLASAWLHLGLRP